MNLRFTLNISFLVILWKLINIWKLNFFLWRCSLTRWRWSQRRLLKCLEIKVYLILQKDLSHDVIKNLSLLRAFFTALYELQRIHRVVFYMLNLIFIFSKVSLLGFGILRFSKFSFRRLSLFLQLLAHTYVRVRSLRWGLLLWTILMVNLHESNIFFRFQTERWIKARILWKFMVLLNRQKWCFRLVIRKAEE